MPCVPPGTVARRAGQAKPASRTSNAAARAGVPGDPALPHSGLGRGDVQVADLTRAYADFFAVEEYHLSFRRFDGGHSPVVKRAAFVATDASILLPYDPRRDAVLVIEQFRAGPFARGDAAPWLLEPVAGRIDPGETPEGAARRDDTTRRSGGCCCSCQRSQLAPDPTEAVGVARSEGGARREGAAQVASGAAGRPGQDAVVVVVSMREAAEMLQLRPHSVCTKLEGGGSGVENRQ